MQRPLCVISAMDRLSATDYRDTREPGENRTYHRPANTETPSVYDDHHYIHPIERPTP